MKSKNALEVRIYGGFRDFKKLGENNKWWLEAESNHRHEDFQSSALPTELSSQTKRGLYQSFGQFSTMF